MIYSPHILQRKKVRPPQVDEFGRVIADNATEWETICRCRCDDNTITEFKSDNGKVYRPKYHIVCDGRQDIQAGDAIRCLLGEDVRGEGIVYIKKQLNFYNYTELWM